MSGHHWKSHLSWLTLGTILAVVAGWLSGYVLEVSVIFLLICLTWQLVNSMRLYSWLKSWDRDPPESLGIWSEIFGRVGALQKLNDEQHRQYQNVIDEYKDMADAFPDATLILDNNDTITWFNQSAVQLLGLRFPDDQGQAVTNLIREPEFSNWLAVQSHIEGKLEIPCPADNNIKLQISIARFRNDQRLLILSDITDVQNLDRVRRDFIANVSHELRTPLTVLLGYLEVLKSQPDKPDPGAIKRMFKQAVQMHLLLEDLLELSRLQDKETHSGDAEVDIPAVLSALREQLQDLSKGEHKLRFEIQADLKIHGTEADLKSAFQNLLVNAVNYTPARGRIRVRWQETGDGLVFSVKDNGMGIPHRDIPRLTERFYRVGSDRARKTGGTGLGLAIVKHVLNSHRARLEISSELDVGSEFRCVFPSELKV